MADFISWEDFIESKSGDSTDMNKPPQGKGANPYMSMGKNDGGKLRVAKDADKKEPFGSMGGSNVTPANSSLGMPGGQGGVGITETKKGSPYPGGKSDGRIRITKDKKDGKNWGDLKTPGMEPSTVSLGKSPETGVGVTTENLSTADYINFILKKKLM